MLRPFVRFCLVCSCCLLAACGGEAGKGLLRLDPGPDQTGPSRLVTDDPAGPIPEPVLPPDLPVPAAPSRQTAPTPEGEGAEATPRPHRLRYTLVVHSPDAPELAPAFTKASLLGRMADTPPPTRMGLDQRLRSDLQTAEDVLRAYGYHAGTARGKIREQRRGDAGSSDDSPDDSPEGSSDFDDSGDSSTTSSPDSGDDAHEDGATERYVVTVTFTPGPQYTLGDTTVTVAEPHRMQVRDPAQKHRAPAESLEAVGLARGAPALADAVLDAVSAVRENFRDRGYPYAKIAATRYVVDHEAHTLDATVRVDTGPLVYMGDMAVRGDPTVTQGYLDALRTWEPGQVWNQEEVEHFRDALRQSGLFIAATISPADEDDAEGRRAVVTELAPAPQRTVGGALKYDTDFGPGLLGSWEHRNLTGRGDSLRIEAPVWADLQELVATYRLPFFIRTDQDLIARAAARSEDTDAYELQSAMGSVGIERQFSRRWSGSLSVMAEGGSLKDPDEPRRDYFMTGLPGTLTYDGANSLLDATRGFRANLSLAPYTGTYAEDFTVLRPRLDLQAFLPVMGDDTLVMAVRGMYGALAGADAQDVPASLRFYTGGGGSVRGYEYQSLGPRNDSRDPLGGSSAVELGAEARFRFTETWGMVAFLDGGMAYEDRTPDLSEELRWGAGLGIRFYTAIGPIRLDVATPLNPRKKDDSVQIYFSIGQSF